MRIHLGKTWRKLALMVCAALMPYLGALRLGYGAPPDGLPATITLTNAESPSGSATTLTWEDNLGDGYGGYVNPGGYSWTSGGTASTWAIALLSPQAQTDIFAFNPASDWDLAYISPENDDTSESDFLYTLTGTTFAFDSGAEVQTISGGIYPETISVPEGVAGFGGGGALTISGLISAMNAIGRKVQPAKFFGWKGAKRVTS